MNKELIEKATAWVNDKDFDCVVSTNHQVEFTQALADFALEQTAELKAEVERLEKQLDCAATGLLYAEPTLSHLWGVKERLAVEMQEHLRTALQQVRRSQNDIRKLAGSIATCELSGE